jgi:hypothetical protein
MRRISKVTFFFFCLSLLFTSLVLSQATTASKPAKQTAAKSAQNISATVDKTGQHPGTAPISGPATITCTNASSNLPNGQPKPSCFISAPGFNGNLNKGQRAGASGAGTVTLNCNGQGDFLSCSASIQ